MTKYADTFDAVVLGNGGSLQPLTELVELIDANGRAREIELANIRKRLRRNSLSANNLPVFDPSKTGA